MIRPPLWSRALATTLLFPGMVGGLLPWWIGSSAWRLPLDLGVARWLGLVPLGVGLAILASTIHDFATLGRGTLAPWDAPRELVAQRLYAWVRNPMSLGVLACIVGQALLWGSGSAGLYFVVIAVAFHVRVVAFEEPTLGRQFGRPYADYRAKVPRWLPRRSSRR